MTFFLQSLKDQGHLENVSMTVCNVGSRKLTEKDDYGSQAWGLFAPNLTIYGFDADADACEAANADVEDRQVNWKEQHFPYAISNNIGEATLYVTVDPMCSSLYPPNEVYLSRFLGLSELVSLDFTIEIETTTLDAIAQAEKIDEIDFIQIDVQGANLNVLQGATSLLEKSILAVQIEVEFSPLYLNEPLFSEIDRFMRAHGFVLFDLAIARRSRTLLQSQNRPGQVLWGDAFYLRDPLQAEDGAFWKQPDCIFKLACIADILEFTDYSLELLEYLTLQHGKNPIYNFADAIAGSLQQIPALVQAGLNTFPTIQKLESFLTRSVSELVSTSVPETITTFGPPTESFQNNFYLRHNQRRLEHLASLGLDLHGKSVLEVGAGIGDHTSFFLDRGCQVVCTEGRYENLEILKQRFSASLPVFHLDLNEPDPSFEGAFDIVYCYGLLYHLHKPLEAISFMAGHCRNLLLLETCVSYGEHEAINFCEEPAASPTQSISGQGCRPTRSWIFNQLKQHFPHVYMPLTQPSHEEFPTDWTTKSGEGLTRSVFIATRQPLNNPLLVEEIPMQQRY